MSDLKNVPIPGGGFLFTDDGMTLEEAAVVAHEKGFISDDEMGMDGGVTALRRLLYDQIVQNRHRYSEYGNGQLTEDKKAQRQRNERLQREVMEYAGTKGVNDPRYMDMFLCADDLERFGIEVTGKDLVDAELLAKVMQLKPAEVEKSKSAPSDLSLRMVTMIRWVRAGRP